MVTLILVALVFAALLIIQGAKLAPQFFAGPVFPITAPVLTAQAVASGDLVGLSSGNVVRAADTTWNTDLATTQSDFRAIFLGASMQDKVAATARVYGNSTDNLIGVSVGGVWEYDCASATFAVGDLVGPAKDSGNALLSNKVVAVGAEVNAIGRVVKAGASITRVQIRLLSVKNPLARQT